MGSRLLWARLIVNSIALHLKTLTEGGSDFVHVLLYDKETALGVLLGYYILLRSGVYKEQHVRSRLSEVLKVIKNHVDEYRARGEVLYVLKRLDDEAGFVREFIDIEGKMSALLSGSKQLMLESDLCIEDAEDLLYAVWA